MGSRSLGGRAGARPGRDLGIRPLGQKQMGAGPLAGQASARKDVGGRPLGPQGGLGPRPLEIEGRFVLFSRCPGGLLTEESLDFGDEVGGGGKIAGLCRGRLG